MACFVTLWMGSSHSASAQILIGNLTNRTGDTAGSTIGGNPTSQNGKLIAFTMGSTSLTLGDVQLQLAITGGLASGIIPQIDIFQGTSSTNSAATGVSLITLTNPTAANNGSTNASASETYTFTAPGGFVLQAGLTYDIVVREASTSSPSTFSWELGTPQTGSGVGATQNSGAIFSSSFSSSPVSWTSPSGNINWYQVDEFASVPEPSTWVMLGFGLLAIVGFQRRHLKIVR